MIDDQLFNSFDLILILTSHDVTLGCLTGMTRAAAGPRSQVHFCLFRGSTRLRGPWTISLCFASVMTPTSAYWSLRGTWCNKTRYNISVRHSVNINDMIVATSTMFTQVRCLSSQVSLLIPRRVLAIPRAVRTPARVLRIDTEP